MKNLIVRFVGEEQGQYLTEYTLLLAFVFLCLAVLSVTDTVMVFIVALTAVIIAMIRNLLRRFAPTQIELLDQRFAAGELSIEEYQEIKQTLAQTSPSAYARDVVLRPHALGSRGGMYKHRIRYYLVAHESK